LGYKISYKQYKYIEQAAVCANKGDNVAETEVLAWLTDSATMP
jgi:hypothetical protein